MKIRENKNNNKPSYSVSIKLVVILLIAIVIGGIVGTLYVGQYQKGNVINEVQADANTLAANILKELETPAAAIRVLAKNSWVSEVFINSSEENLGLANSLLDRYKEEFNVSVVYLMDVNGVTIASSNRNTNVSFVGKNYSFRPYFQDAMNGEQGLYFALGITSRKRGYYSSFVVRDNASNIIGVAVIKKELDEAEEVFKNYVNSFFISPEGVIFLSSDPDSLFKSLWPLSNATQEQLLELRQFGDEPFESLFPGNLTAGEEVILAENRYIVALWDVIAGWKVVTLKPAESIYFFMIFLTLLTVFLALLTFFFAAYIRLANVSFTRLEEKKTELEYANTRLQELDRVKRLFLASMSHELRTPLNSIIGFTGWLLMGMEGDLNEEQKKQLTMVESSADHLLGLINDILDISKIEAGKVELVIEKFEIAEVVNDVVNSVLPLAKDKGLKLVSNFPEELVLNSDKRRIKQILMNLVSNAIKFTDQGIVKIMVKSLNNKDLEVIVSDSGIGIKKEDIELLFKPFQQVDMSSTKKHGGTGLGLHLCKKLIELLHGDISVKSQFGEGSEFKFIIPIKFKEVV